VIAKVESGRRNVVTVDELLVIAAALDVPPLRLLIPLDDGDVEMLPDKTVNPWEAVRQFAGLDSEEMLLFEQFRNDERALRDQVASIPAVSAHSLGPRQLHLAVIQQTYDRLVRIQRRLADRGLAAPMVANGDLAKRIEGILDNAPAAVDEMRPAVTEARATDRPPIVAAIVTSDRGVLISRRNDNDPPWGFITGEQDVVKDDLPEHTAIREVKEETGLEIEAGEVIGERDHPQTGRHMIYIAAHPVRDTDVFPVDSAELAEVRWVGLAEAVELLPGMFERVHTYLAATIGTGSES
jgi:8-oxo-dGTP diphosphatase